MKHCKRCGKEFTPQKGLLNYCSLACRNTREHSDETKQKMREANLKNNSSKNFFNEDGSIKRNKANTKHERILVNCKHCGIQFETIKKKPSQYCSSDCWNKNSGGLRKGSGIGKKGWYKGIYCDSTYELVYIIYNLDHNINFKRSKLKIPYYYKGKNKQYHPDFEVDNKLIELKGYHTDQVDVKVEATIKAGYEIEILYKNDLKYAFDYVKNTYNYNKLEELYE